MYKLRSAPGETFSSGALCFFVVYFGGGAFLPQNRRAAEPQDRRTAGPQRRVVCARRGGGRPPSADGGRTAWIEQSRAGLSAYVEGLPRGAPGRRDLPPLPAEGCKTILQRGAGNPQQPFGSDAFSLTGWFPFDGAAAPGLCFPYTLFCPCGLVSHENAWKFNSARCIFSTGRCLPQQSFCFLSQARGEGKTPLTPPALRLRSPSARPWAAPPHTVRNRG